MQISSVEDTNWDSVIDMPWTNGTFASSYDWDEFSNSASLDPFYQDYDWSFPATLFGGQSIQPQPSAFIDYLGNAQIEASHEPVPNSLQSMLGAEVIDPPMITQYEMGQEISTNLNMFGLIPDVNQYDDTSNGLIGASTLSRDAQIQELSPFGMPLYSQVLANEGYYWT